MYKVFFKDSWFLLTDNQNLLQKNIHFFVHQDFNSTKQFIHRQLQQNEPFAVTLYHNDLEELFSIFKSCFIYVKAAGGVVCDRGNMLIIKRLGMYDLPKGHLEAGETIEACAAREVEEECGIKGVAITSPLIHTLHIYFRNENWHLKKTYWYTMTCSPCQKLSSQTEEDIEEVFWCPVGELDKITSHTYPSLLPVFEAVTKKN